MITSRLLSLIRVGHGCSQRGVLDMLLVSCCLGFEDLAIHIPSSNLRPGMVLFGASILAAAAAVVPVRRQLWVVRRLPLHAAVLRVSTRGAKV